MDTYQGELYEFHRTDVPESLKLNLHLSTAPPPLEPKIVTSYRVSGASLPWSRLGDEFHRDLNSLISSRSLVEELETLIASMKTGFLQPLK